MLAKHFSHMFYAPKQSLSDADREPAKWLDIIIHVAVLSLIPTVCTYIASVHIGWNFGVTELFLVPSDKALTISIATFVLLNLGVYAIGYGICWLAQTFNVKPKAVHCVELAVFTSVPLCSWFYRALPGALHKCSGRNAGFNGFGLFTLYRCTYLYAHTGRRGICLLYLGGYTRVGDVGKHDWRLHILHESALDPDKKKQ